MNFKAYTGHSRTGPWNSVGSATTFKGAAGLVKSALRMNGHPYGAIFDSKGASIQGAGDWKKPVKQHVRKNPTNHLGEREFQTYAAWKRAVKQIDQNAKFDGDKDICTAIGIGEWYGDKGSIYTDADKKLIARMSKTKRNPRKVMYKMTEKPVHRKKLGLFVRWSNRDKQWLKVGESHDKALLMRLGIKMHKKSGCAAKIEPIK